MTRWHARTTPIPDPGPLSAGWRPGSTLFVQDGDGFLAHGEVARHAPGGTDRFAAAGRWFADLLTDIEVDDPLGVPGSGPLAFGAFTFDPSTPGSVLLVPRTVVARRDGRAWRTEIREVDARKPEPSGDRAGAVGVGAAGQAEGARSRGADPADVAPTPVGRAEASAGAGTAGAGTAPGGRAAATGVTDRVRFEGSTTSELAWLAAVDTAVRRIRAGELDKVVLARDRRVWSRVPFDVGRLVDDLEARFPSCQTFAVDGLVGASPEVLAARTGARLRSLVLAGTAPRDADPGRDAAHARALLGSDKDRREHALALASVVDALGPLTRDLTVEPDPRILRLANVMHLATPVAAELDGDTPVLEVVGRLHPSAAVCGTPTEAARALIAEVEDLDRSRYSGPVGWTDARGDGQFAIALRCAEVTGDRARLFAGAGIVDGSLPEAELEETRLKLRAMQSAFEARPAGPDGGR